MTAADVAADTSVEDTVGGINLLLTSVLLALQAGEIPRRRVTP